MSRATIDAKWGPAYRMAEEGMTAKQIARAMGKTPGGVVAWAKRDGVALAKHKRVRMPAPPKEPAKRGPKVKPWMAERSAEMSAMYAQGLTLEKIGAHFGLTRQLVQQCLHRIGVNREHSIRFVQAADAAARRERAVALRKEEKWGVPVELWRECRANGAVRAFENQRQSASNRGIKWTLTFGDWWAVWQASGKFHLRGKGIGRYCMSRIRDEGGYVLGNVHVQTIQKNSSDGFAKARASTEKKPFVGVFCIFPGRELAWLAKVGKVRLGYHASAEAANAVRMAWIAANKGSAKGWTIQKGCKTKPYLMQCAGFPKKSYATQAEAEAAYAACLEAKRSLQLEAA